MRSTLLLIPVLWLATACGGNGDERLRGAPPAAAMLAPADRTARLDEELQDMETELEAALTGELDRLLRAEAITDGLMEAERRIDWLAAGYDLEARLRQLQAMADRVVAILRRGATLETVEPDIRTLLTAASDLRVRIREPGGGPAPPPLDSLLDQDPLRDARSGAVEAVTAASESDDEEEEETPQPAAQGRRGPLGTPINNPDNDRR